MKDITQIEQTEFINDLSSLLNNWNEQDQTTKKQLLQIISERLELKQYPLFENKTTVILIYKGNANNVSFIGDTTGWADPIKFRKLFGTDFYYLILNL
ncbi:MAG: hypothetical protein HXY50_07410 [Ignavibacteriaceae bacterium]|nr:hypothetical protein [Ignavibacteriaceae bacterium]